MTGNPTVTTTIINIIFIFIMTTILQMVIKFSNKISTFDNSPKFPTDGNKIILQQVHLF